MVCAPALHKYVTPPVAVSVVELPAQAKLLPMIFTVGTCITLTVTVLVPVQLLASVTVTVYVVVTLGVTVMDEPVPAFDHK